MPADFVFLSIWSIVVRCSFLYSQLSLFHSIIGGFTRQKSGPTTIINCTLEAFFFHILLFFFFFPLFNDQQSFLRIFRVLFCIFLLCPSKIVNSNFFWQNTIHITVLSCRGFQSSSNPLWFLNISKFKINSKLLQVQQTLFKSLNFKMIQVRNSSVFKKNFYFFFFIL